VPALYRRMTPGDLEAIAAIEREVHAHPWTLGNFADSIEEGYHCWVAEHQSELVAYGVVTVAAGEAHLLNLTVARAWQRRGVGSQMTRFMLQVARDQGAHLLFLEVRPSNAAARALYARSGFAEIGRRRDYYPAGEGREDAVVMQVNLA
jgi:[ribosomal protein S18]-alanine N-acetyltransferase